MIAAAVAAIALATWFALRSQPSVTLPDAPTPPRSAAPAPGQRPEGAPAQPIAISDEPTPVPPPDGNKAPAAAGTDLTLPAASTTPVAGYIEFPDHTWYPPLNGVTKAPKVEFHQLAPFAKVVGRWRDPTGREWYLHENGVRSTTFRNAQGEDVGLVSKDVPTKPVLDDAPRK